MKIETFKVLMSENRAMYNFLSGIMLMDEQFSFSNKNVFNDVEYNIKYTGKSEIFDKIIDNIKSRFIWMY